MAEVFLQRRLLIKLVCTLQWCSLLHFYRVSVLQVCMLIYFFIFSNACGAERIMSKIVCVLLAFVSISHYLKAKRKLNVFLLFQSPVSHQNQKCLAQYCARSKCCEGIVESICFLPHCIIVFLWYKYVYVGSKHSREAVKKIANPILVLFEFHELSISRVVMFE